MMTRLLAATALALSFPLSSMAYDKDKTPKVAEIEIGPEVGAAAPALAATLPGGETATIEAISGTQGVALVFVRSADWCPFCTRQLVDLKKAVTPLEERGWKLAALSYDSREILDGFADSSEISYPLLSDVGSETITAFGLLNEEMAGKPRFGGIPHPAIVFISNDGTVLEVLREEGYKDRPPVETVVSTADALAASGS